MERGMFFSESPGRRVTGSEEMVINGILLQWAFQSFQLTLEKTFQCKTVRIGYKWRRCSAIFRNRGSIS
jgi:hypothetical protein